MSNTRLRAWIFRLLGALPGHTMIDVFPRSGIVMRAWLDYTGQEVPDVPQDATPINPPPGESP